MLIGLCARGPFLHLFYVWLCPFFKVYLRTNSHLKVEPRKTQRFIKGIIFHIVVYVLGFTVNHQVLAGSKLLHVC